MHALLIIALVALCMQQIFGNSAGGVENQPSKIENNNDAVTNLLSDIEKFALNVDKAASQISQPLAELEKMFVHQIRQRNRDSREEVFDRIRDNYSDLRKRIGSQMKLPDDIAMSSSFFGMNLQNKEGRSFLDLSIPFLPMKLSITSKTQSPKIPAVRARKPLEDATDVTTPAPKVFPETVEASSEEAIPRVESANTEEESVATQTFPKLRPDIDLEKIHNEARNELEQMISEAQEKQKNLGASSDDNDQYSKRKGDVAEVTEDSEPDGRLLSEMLYSEENFDKLTRRVLKKPGKWVLDSKIVPKKVKKQMNKAVNKVLAKGDRGKPYREDSYYHSEYPVRKPTKSKHQGYHSRHRLDFDDRFNDYELEERFSPRSHDVPRHLDQSDEKIVIAFTPEGLPLKLKIDPDVQDPLRFLHEVLNAAGVSLNVPVDSDVHPEPSGTEIMQLGFGSDGMVTRAVSVDLSDSSNLDSFLKSLRKYKVLSEGTYTD